MREPSTRQMDLADLIRERDVQTLYQPIISAAEGRSFAHEALIRGPADSTLSSPLALFAAARRIGAVHELDCMALQLAVGRFVARKFRGKLFVNLLPQTLAARPDFCSWLQRVLLDDGLPPDRVVIEITEHGEQLDATPVREQGRKLRAMGCEIAIDDFGTGLSGLKIWSELRPDYVKIDRYFISRLEQDSVAPEILRAMLDMAHVLGSRVIAEGVENARQLELLRDLGVDYLQGYHICEPQFEQAADTGGFHILRQPAPSATAVACVGDLCLDRQPLPPRARVGDAVALFQANPEWDSLPVVDEGKPVGMLRRDELLLMLSKPLYPEIYNPKPVSRLMDAHALVVDERMRLSQASRLLTRNRKARLNEDFIIARDGTYRGLGRTIELLHHITEQQLHDAQQSNPLTLLPGNREIDAEIFRLLALRAPFAICHADIDCFKPFNDEYGYSYGDQVLLHLAGLCRAAAVEGLDFVGHPGGDDFILIMRSQDWQERVTRLVENFSASCSQFYSSEHRAAGGFTGRARDGGERHFPLMTLSIGAVSVDPDGQESSAAVMRSLSAAKQHAKSRIGNAVVVNDGEAERTMRLPLIRSRAC